MFKKENDDQEERDITEAGFRDAFYRAQEEKERMEEGSSPEVVDEKVSTGELSLLFDATSIKLGEGISLSGPCRLYVEASTFSTIKSASTPDRSQVCGLGFFQKGQKVHGLETWPAPGTSIDLTGLGPGEIEVKAVAGQELLKKDKYFILFKILL